MNLFKKCLIRQMGDSTYADYISLCQEHFSGDKKDPTDAKPIFDDMYGRLKRESHPNFSERLNDVAATMNATMRIRRNFVFVIIAYIVGNFALLFLNLDYTVTCIAIALLGVCFLYKLAQFVNHRYCVLDVYLFLIYKSVLEKLEKEWKLNGLD